MDRLRAPLEQLDRRGIEADGDRARHLEHEAGPGRWTPPALVRAVAVPRAVHAEVGPDLEPVREADEEVLADRVDRLDPHPDDPPDLGHGPGPRVRAAVTTRPTRYGRRPAAVRASVSPSGIGSRRAVIAP